MKKILCLLFLLIFIATPAHAGSNYGVQETHNVMVWSGFQIRRHIGNLAGSWTRVNWVVTNGSNAIEITYQDKDYCHVEANAPIQGAKITCYMYYYGDISTEEHIINVSSDGQLILTASPSGGDVLWGEKVLLQANQADANIYYTLDGSTPTTDSYKYYPDRGITITNSCTLKAFAVKARYTPSEILTENYTISDNFKDKTVEGVEMKFKITNNSAKTCEVVSNSISQNTSGNITIPKEVKGFKVTGIQDYALKYCDKITSVIIPNTVTTIGDQVFYGCSNLHTVQIPNSVAQIGNWAFKGCTSLTSVTLPESLAKMGDNLFDGCTNLSSVVIPNNIQSIGQYAFRKCSSLVSVIIPNSVTSIGRYAFLFCM